MRQTVRMFATLMSLAAMCGGAWAQTPPPADSRPVEFTNDIMPLLSRLGCNTAACHGASQGRGGLQLSLFGGDAASDYAALTLTAPGRRINRVEPERSLLLAKITATVTHGGGARVQVGSPEHNLMSTWVAQRAPWGSDQSPHIVGISVNPAEYTLGKDAAAQLSVIATFSDGAQKDVTRDTLFHSRDAAVATVAEGGVVKAVDFGEAVLVASYLRRFAVVRVVVPQPQSTPWVDVPPNNRVDELVFAKLKKLGIPPSELCSDAEFVRRLYLDVIGTLPAPDQVRTFLADTDPQKRSKLIDQLLSRDEFADYWSLKWGDLLRIKSEYPVNVWPKAVQVYYRWLHDALQANKPFDQFVRELLTLNGSNFRCPPVNFFRAMPGRTPQAFAETTALVFMGARFNCVRCHAHPTETWTLDDEVGLAAFFAKVAIKPTNEWKEEIVYFNADGGVWHPRTKQLVKPKVLDGPPLDLGPEEDPRIPFAQWLTSPQNPWFAKNAVNRVWSWLLGRGIVDEPDDLRTTNPPENPELLDFLSQEFVSHQFDLRHIYRLILNSRTYQLSSSTNALNARDVAHFSHYRLKRLGAEELLDAVSQVTGSAEPFSSWIPVPALRLPNGYRATQLPDSDIDCTFLDTFGRPSRDTPYEGDRNADPTARQAMFLMSSDTLQWKIAGGERIKQWFAAQKSDADIIDETYLAALSRLPTDEERQKAAAFLTKHQAARVEAVQDLVWAVITTKEFLVNH
jgi:hypothetical protein